MNNKKSKLIFIILVLLIILGGMFYFYFNTKNTNAVSSSNEQERQAIVTKQDISKTITGSGEITTSQEEKLKLKSNRYLKEVYVGENQLVKKGENLVKYTNGTYLTAPYNLVVKSQNLGKIGEICDADTHYIEVANIDNLAITLNINESDKNSLKVGQEVKIKPNAFEDKIYQGTVKKINEIGTYDANGSSFKITIEFQNDLMLNIGMSAFCEITVEKAEQTLAIPIQAVKNIGNEKYVTIVKEDGTTEEIKVETGLSNDIYVEIKSGLELNQKIQYIDISNNSNNSFDSIGQSIPMGS